MRMTPCRFLLLRLFNVTFGRSATANQLLRMILVKVLVTNRATADRYMASSRFFDPRELD
jgi:hypothetical protein